MLGEEDPEEFKQHVFRAGGSIGLQ
ncbi:uncharacterized, partial [Tachysurus ichikawai]